MKNINLVLNVVLTIAVIILFVLVLKKDNDNPTVKPENTEEISSLSDSTSNIAKPVRIAYVNTDTILEEYKYFQELQKKLELRQNNAEYQLSQKMKELESDYKNLLSKIKLGLITETEAENQFAEKQQKVEEYRNTVRNQLIQEEQTLTESLYDSIVSYIKRYNEKGHVGFNYILGFSKGGGILHADEQFDLTQAVLGGLNGEYDKRKAKK